MIDRIQFSVTASGTNGAATGTAYSNPVAGEVLKVHLDYTDVNALTDIALSDDMDPAAEEIVNLDDTNSDTTLYPRRSCQNNLGTTMAISDDPWVYTHYVVHGRLKLTIAEADDADVVTATVWIRS